MINKESRGVVKVVIPRELKRKLNQKLKKTDYGTYSAFVRDRIYHFVYSGEDDEKK